MTCINLTYTLHRLGPLAYSESELTSETKNPFRHFGRIPWIGDQPIAGPLPIQDITTQKNTDIHPCFKWDLNP